MKIKNIYYIGVALLLAGCSNEAELSTSDTLSGGDKTPLNIEATLNTGKTITRASGTSFASGDVLNVYLRHTTSGSKGSYVTTAADQAPKLVTLTLSENVAAPTTIPTDKFNETLYWDDFSNSNSTDTDLRTSGHGLQSYYGYCYNGKTEVTLTDQTAGTLTWTIATNQSTATAVKNQDLLWSAEQETVTYAHTDSKTGAHGTLTIPFTHAMSEVTVTINAGTGFSGNPLTSTALTLNNMNTVATLTAPTSTVTSTTQANITMYGADYSSGLTRNYSAIVAPGTKLKVDDVLLNINGVDGNYYELKITSDMISSSNWGAGHTDTDVGTDYILTKPGYNYNLDVTVNKTKIDVKATIKDWTDVTASGTGTIQYPNDYTDLVVDDSLVSSSKEQVSTINVDKFKVSNSSTFSLFSYKSAEAEAAAVTTTANDSYDFVTVPTFDGTNNKWNNNPLIYWPNGSDNYYFRALAKYKGKDTSDATKDVLESVGTYNADKTKADKGTAVSQGTMAEGHDYLWGTTPKHLGNTNHKEYKRGAAIPPRTGNVPIAFEHAMSKIKFTLSTTSDASAVTLDGATITVSGIYTDGTISIEDGTITTTGSTGSVSALAQGAEYIVIPQNFGSYTDDAIVTVTLKDNTTYKLKLKDCIVTSTKDNDDPTEITEWTHGNFYTYTIHLEKEKITFRALIKDWETSVNGNGNANLEWD